MVRKGGLEPPWAAPLEPKSSASTNSATFAAAFAKRVIIAGPGPGRQENAPSAAPAFPRKCSPFGAMRQISRVGRSLRKLSRRVAARAQGVAAGRRRDLSLRPHRGRLRRRRRRCAADERLAALDRYERALDAIEAGAPPAGAALPRARRRRSHATACRWRRSATSCPHSGRTSRRRATRPSSSCSTTAVARPIPSAG